MEEDSYKNGEKVLKISLTEYEHTCSDGCCYNYGIITKVNGTELPSHNTDVETALRQVLEHLGYKVDIEYNFDFD